MSIKEKIRFILESKKNFLLLNGIDIYTLEWKEIAKTIFAMDLTSSLCLYAREAGIIAIRINAEPKIREYLNSFILEQASQIDFSSYSVVDYKDGYYHIEFDKLSKENNIKMFEFVFSKILPGII